MGWMKNTIDLTMRADKIRLHDHMLDTLDETPEPTAEEIALEQAERVRFDAFRRMDYQFDADDVCKMRRERGPKDEWISGHELFLNSRREKK